MLLKKLAKIIPENTFQQKKKKPGLKFNPGLALIEQLGPGCLALTELTRLGERKLRMNGKKLVRLRGFAAFCKEMYEKLARWV